MNLQELLTDGCVSLLALMTIVQIAPVKIDPWSWLARAIGRAINAEVIKKLDAHITMDDRRTADGHRTRILYFNNELLRDIDHTKSLSANSPHTSCLHIFRHIAPKFFDRRQPACEILTPSGEKSDGAICARPIYG